MRPLDAFRMSIGRTPDGWTLVDQVEDATRDMSIFRDQQNSLAFGFGPTKGDPLKLDPDWRENLRLAKRVSGFGFGRVEEGFLGQTKALVDPVMRALKVWQPETVGLYGFSQGGIIAQLMLRFLISRASSRLDGIAFASPAGMDQMAAEDFRRVLSQGRHTFRRISAWGDPVPLSTLLFGFVHSGPHFWCGPYRFLPSLKFPSPIHNGDFYLNHLEAF